MKRIFRSILSMVFAVFLFSGYPFAQEISKEGIIEELKELKDRTQRLEKALTNLEEEELQGKENTDDTILHNGQRGIRERKEALEKFIEGVELSGTVEVEAVYEHSKPKVGEKEEYSDLTVSSVELAVDAKITYQLRTHVLFDYEDGESVEIDEAIIHFQAEGVCKPDLSCNSPWYASMGKMDVPFGYYESHLLSDSLTQGLGEAKETAVIVGVYNDMLNFATGVFNGDIKEVESDDHIENFVGAFMFTLPEDVIPNLTLMAGISYISNIADSDELTNFIEEEYESNSIEDYVAGISSFLSVSLLEHYFIEAEYVGALEAFEEDRNFKPEAWNLEFAFRPIDVFEIALRYGGSEESLNFLPKTQIGISGVYEIFNNTSISLEYLYDKFENDDEINTITAQFAVEF